MRAAAQAIAGNETPSDWLLGAVARSAYEIGRCILTDVRLPTRVELTEDITALRNASRLINRLLFPFLQDGSASLLLSDYLLREGEHRLEYEGELHRYLIDLAERCEAKLEQVPKGGGQGRPLSSLVEENTAASGTVCALILQMLWKQTHGRLPAMNSGHVHQACSELWLAAGGKGTKTFGWRYDLQEARLARYARDATTLAKQIGVQSIHPETA